MGCQMQPPTFFILLTHHTESSFGPLSLLLSFDFLPSHLCFQLVNFNFLHLSINTSLNRFNPSTPHPIIFFQLPTLYPLSQVSVSLIISSSLHCSCRPPTMVQYASISSLLLLASLLFLVLHPYCATAATYNVVQLGAKGDGHTDCTKAFLNAWTAACSSTSPAIIYVPPGKYLLRSVVFRGCKNRDITFRIDATLVAPSDYRVIGNAANWLAFTDVSGVSIIGGVLDGQGTGLWHCKRSGKRCPSGATVRYYYYYLSSWSQPVSKTIIHTGGLRFIESNSREIFLCACADTGTY